METIQIAIANAPYAAALRDLLARSGPWKVQCVEAPDWSSDGVMVVDSTRLEQCSIPIERPERVVLIAPSDPQLLARAWDAGVNSVVNETDSINTAALAVMSVRLRMLKRSGRKGRRQSW